MVGMHLFFNRFLFREEIEAWKYGPVIPGIYHQFKMFRDKLIDGPMHESGIQAISEELDSDRVETLRESARELIDALFNA